MSVDMIINTKGHFFFFFFLQLTGDLTQIDSLHVNNYYAKLICFKQLTEIICRAFFLKIS